MDKDKILKWVDDLIDAYETEYDMVLQERSCDYKKDSAELDAEVKKLKVEIRELLFEPKTPCEICEPKTNPLCTQECQDVCPLTEKTHADAGAD
jgi:hypothetical protein